MPSFRDRIEHPEWLEDWDPERFLKLYRGGRIPDELAGYLLLATLRRGLRCVYSTNLRAAWKLLLMALLDRWDWSIVDRTERAVYLVRWFYVRVAFGLLQATGCRMDLGRRESPAPTRCECGWAGRRRDAVHAYQDDGTGEDVEPVDECPRCGQEV